MARPAKTLAQHIADKSFRPARHGHMLGDRGEPLPNELEEYRARYLAARSARERQAVLADFVDALEEDPLATARARAQATLDAIRAMGPADLSDVSMERIPKGTGATVAVTLGDGSAWQLRCTGEEADRIVALERARDTTGITWRSCTCEFCSREPVAGPAELLTTWDEPDRGRHKRPLSGEEADFLLREDHPGGTRGPKQLVPRAQQAMELYAGGLSLRQTASELGCSASTVGRDLARLSVQRRPRGSPRR